jgi:hypothetical protein
MTTFEQKLISKIRESKDPEKMMDYIEKLLFSPQTFQEVSAAHSAQPES